MDINCPDSVQGCDDKKRSCGLESVRNLATRSCKNGYALLFGRVRDNGGAYREPLWKISSVSTASSAVFTIRIDRVEMSRNSLILRKLMQRKWSGLLRSCMNLRESI